MAFISVMKYLNLKGLKYDARFKIYRSIREKILRKGKDYKMVTVERVRVNENLDPTQFEV